MRADTRRYGCEWCGARFLWQHEIRRHRCRPALRPSAALPPSVPPEGSARGRVERQLLTFDVEADGDEGEGEGEGGEGAAEAAGDAEGYACGTCGSVFFDQVSLKRHVRRVHLSTRSVYTST